MPIVDESKQNKGVNNNTRNKQMAIDMEYYNRLNHLRFKSPYLGAKYQQRVIPVRTLNGIQDVFVDNRGTIKQGGHTHSKLYNYSNKNRTHPIKGAYAREVDSWNNNTSPIKALVNSGIGYALAPAAQAVYDYTKGALDISKNPTKASNYLVMLPAIGYAVKAPLKRGVEVAMRTSNNANPIEDIVYNMHKASPKKHAGVLSYISTGVGYNTYAPEAYTGFQKAAKGNDMIDAYLYNKTINPSYGVKKINVDYGPHENYIRKIYPYKNIPVYENTETLDFFTKKPMQKASNITNKTPWKGANNNLDFGDNGVDAAGHLVQEGSSKISGSKVLTKYARDNAEAKYRSTYKVSPNIQSDRSLDYNPEDPFLKDSETGQYLKDENGNLVNNSQWNAPLGYKLLKTIHDINAGTSMVLSMLPSTTARGIGNAMFIGQNLADIHHDIKDKNYTSAGLNTAFTFAPLWY